MNAVHFSSRHAEHYTPPRVLDAVIACLEAIDVDPCSDGNTPPNVPARQHFTRDQDGLAQPWFGRVYMNPPYGRREIDRWVAKLCEEVSAGHTTEAIALVPARTDTQWFRRLSEYVCCFVRGRLTFIGNRDAAPFPSALFYLGPDVEKFSRAFEALGDVWHRR